MTCINARKFIVNHALLSSTSSVRLLQFACVASSDVQEHVRSCLESGHHTELRIAAAPGYHACTSLPLYNVS